MADPNARTPTGPTLAPSEEEHIFYNVLPQEKSDGPLATTDAAAASTLASAPQISNTVTASSRASLPHINKRLLLIIIAGVVIVAVGGFFVYRLLFSPTEAPPEPPAQAPTNQEPEPPKEPQQPEGVTTSNDWQKQYFGEEICQNVTVCGDTSDPDRDGFTNLEENDGQTDPNNSDSDGDKLADGDEVHVFGSDPLKAKTEGGAYTDADYAQYGYDLATDKQYTQDKLADIITKIKQYGLHQPTIKALGEEALGYYDFTNTDGSEGDPLEGFDTSANAQLDRDTQRLDTIKKIGAGLVKYQAEHQTYPNTTDFGQMVEEVKPYITVATNFSDPVNKSKYVYGYIVGKEAADFNLTYFSETQNLLIKYSSAQAQADASKQSATEMDDIRTRDLETLQTALLLYSSHNIDSHSTQQYVFPTVEQYKSALLNGGYISQIPTDPKTGQDYPYTVGDKFDTFTVKAVLDNPPQGMVGYVCDQDQCKTY